MKRGRVCNILVTSRKNCQNPQKTFWNLNNLSFYLSFNRKLWSFWFDFGARQGCGNLVNSWQWFQNQVKGPLYKENFSSFKTLFEDNLFGREQGFETLAAPKMIVKTKTRKKKTCDNFPKTLNEHREDRFYWSQDRLWKPHWGHIGTWLMLPSLLDVLLQQPANVLLQQPQLYKALLA